MSKNCNFTELVGNFKFEGKLVESKDHVCGHINDTYILDFIKEDGSACKYILQRINLDVFGCPEKLMENITNVTAHIRKKIIEANGDPLRETLNIIPTKDGKSYYKTEGGDCWRGFIFIDGAKTYQIVENPQHLYTCGKTLGKFQKYLSDFSAETLHETIPNFHNTAKRYECFCDAIKKDAVGRVKSVQAEIDFLHERSKEMSLLIDLINIGKLPLRVTHNDTKFNNIMIDEKTDEGIAVIDLDTVMPGLSLYDFGDSIRSSATTALEDEADLSKVNFDMNLFEQFTKGFLESVKDSLTEEEIKYLAFSAKLITLELGMRFLTDHINGDTYFKVHRPNHNLDRARNQFKLVKDMEARMDEMNEIVKKYC